jgi:hypothetical protein
VRVDIQGRFRATHPLAVEWFTYSHNSLQHRFVSKSASFLAHHYDNL